MYGVRDAAHYESVNKMIDPSADTNTRANLSIPHQLRDELSSLHRQLQEIQARIAELQLDTSPEPCTRAVMETVVDHDTDVDRDTESEDKPDITLAELQKRLADRLRSLDAELNEDDR